MRRSQRRVAQFMLAFSVAFLVWDVVFLVGNVAVLPSRPMSGLFWATVQVANTVFMIYMIGFWRKRLK